MLSEELKILQENRLKDETINETRERLMQEKKLLPAPPTQPVRDEEGFAIDDLIIPRLKIVQPTNRNENAKVGYFHNVLTGEEKEKLEKVTFLRRYMGRVMFPENDFSGLRICWSYDGEVPAREEILAKTGEEPKAEKCVSGTKDARVFHCDFAKWRESENKKQPHQPPLCKETVSFLGVMDAVPFSISFHGMAISAVKKMIGSVYLLKKQAAMRGNNLHLRDFRMEIGLKMEKNNKGKFFVPVISGIEEIKDQEEKSLLNTFFHSLGHTSSDRMLPKEEEVNTAD